ncbi:hypothetical protein D3C78_1498390 [compost metagenome]
MQVRALHPISQQIYALRISLALQIGCVVGFGMRHQRRRRSIKPFDQQATFLIDIKTEGTGDF